MNFDNLYILLFFVCTKISNTLRSFIFQYINQIVIVYDTNTNYNYTLYYYLMYPFRSSWDGNFHIIIMNRNNTYNIIYNGKLLRKFDLSGINNNPPVRKSITLVSHDVDKVSNFNLRELDHYASMVKHIESKNSFIDVETRMDVIFDRMGVDCKSINIVHQKNNTNNPMLKFTSISIDDILVEKCKLDDLYTGLSCNE